MSVRKKKIKTILILIAVIGILVFLILEKSFDVLAGYSGIIALLFLVVIIVDYEKLIREKEWQVGYLRKISLDYLALLSKEEREIVSRDLDRTIKNIEETKSNIKLFAICEIIFIALIIIFLVLHNVFS